tara:strand:+ start:3951 stop:4130 length:180 start_codon:yes stop_codon:yes gene_type:complete
MQKIGYSIKLWHSDSNKYEDLGMFIDAVTRKEAIKVFKDQTKWVEKENTKLVAIPPVCR